VDVLQTELSFLDRTYDVLKRRSA